MNAGVHTLNHLCCVCHKSAFNPTKPVLKVPVLLESTTPPAPSRDFLGGKRISMELNLDPGASSRNAGRGSEFLKMFLLNVGARG